MGFLAIKVVGIPMKSRVVEGIWLVHSRGDSHKGCNKATVRDLEVSLRLLYFGGDHLTGSRK